MRALVVFLLFALLFISQINTILDIDLWWNLKTGEYILENLEVPRQDIFSYTMKGRPWIDHEWFSQVLYYLTFSRFGWLGLNVLKAFIISLCFFVLLCFSVSKYNKISYVLLLILGSILAFGYRSFLRPEIFSYLFLCAFLYILESERKIYMLPLLQIVWVNVHGYFILGPILILFYSIGERERFKRYIAVFVFACLACFINPYFYRGAFYPLRILIDTFTEQRLFMQEVHELMMPIRFGFARYSFFWIFVILTSFTFIINLRGAKLRHILLFGISFLASYVSIRNMPIFIFVGLHLSNINLNEAPVTKDISDNKYYIPVILISCALMYLFVSNKYYAFTNQLGMRKTESGFSELFMPSGACDFLENNNVKGPIFNTLDFGPYIGYRFYPERRIFIDTRTDLYKDDFYSLYRKAQNYPGEWENIHKKYGFETVLLRHLFSGTEKLMFYLHSHKDWVLVYYDENSCVFLKDTPENSAVIERSRIDFENKDIEDPDVNIRIARFFEKIGEMELAERVYVLLLRQNPRFLEAGNNLAAIYINSNRYEEGIALIQEFLDYYPDSSELYANIGTAYLRLGMRDKGILMLEKSAEINPYFRNTAYLLGIAYLEKGELGRARRQFIKYLRLDPYNARVHRILGDIYMQKGLLEKADREYNEADALEGLD